MERQLHGFLYEQAIINQLGFIKEDNYSSEWDAIYKNIPIQIKCVKYGSSIALGDYYRNAHKTQDFFLIIGFWRHNRNNIVDEYIIYINHKKWNKFFSWEKAGKVKEYFKWALAYEGFFNHEYDSTWKMEINKFKTSFNSEHITLNFKRQHKVRQLRLQCSIPFNKFKYFLENFEWKEKPKTTWIGFIQKKAFQNG